MSNDGLDPAGRVIARSTLVRALRAAGEAIRRAAPTSRAGAALVRARRNVAAAPPDERIRLAGVVMLAAALVHEMLRPLTSMAARSTAPHALALPAMALGVVMIAAAPAIARAWPRSAIGRSAARAWRRRP